MGWVPRQVTRGNRSYEQLEMEAQWCWLQWEMEKTILRGLLGLSASKIKSSTGMPGRSHQIQADSVWTASISRSALELRMRAGACK